MSSSCKAILSILISFVYFKVPMIGLFFILSVSTQAHAQDFYSAESPPSGQVRYSNIREAVKLGNYSLAENLIQEEWNVRQGDPELEFYQVDLWLRKANQLYEKEQYKSAMDYYTKVYKFWPNHPTVRERIDRWKGKRPYNKNLQSKELGDMPIQKNSPESIVSGVGYDTNMNMELLLLKDKLDRNNERLESFLSTIYIFIGLLVAIILFLFAIFWRLILSPKHDSIPMANLKMNAGERK